MRKKGNIGFVLCCLLLVCPISFPKSQRLPTFDFVILQSPADSPAIRVQGNTKLVHADMPPASTFKIVLVWSALQSGWNSEEKFYVREKRIPSAPGLVGLKDALFYSSNEFFQQLYGKLDQKIVESSILQLGLSDEIPKGWLSDKKYIFKGGNLKVTTWREHQMMRKLVSAEGKMADQLRLALYWSGCRVSGRNLSFYGKTGSWADTYWFNGFWTEDKRVRRIKTVLLTGKEGSRDKAISMFYAGSGCNPPELH